MRVIVFLGASMHGALPAFSADMIRAMRRRGIDAMPFDLGETRSTQWVSDRLKEIVPVDFLLSFQILTTFRDPDGHSIAQIAGAPLVSLYVDHPLLQFHNLHQADPRCAILTVDPSHTDAIRAVHGADHFAHLDFCPHGGIGETVALPDDPAPFARQRPIQIMFSGCYYRPDPPYADIFPENVRQIFRDAADIALATEWISPLAALEQALAARGLDLDDPALQQDLKVLRGMCCFIGEHVRKERRMRFFAAAHRVGLPLTVYGRDFDGARERFANIDFRGAADFSDILRLMGQSRMVVGTNANFGRGSHERPLSAMLAGAVAATDTSAYYRARFTPGRDIALFRWQHLDEDLAALRALAADPAALLAMARAGQEKADARERWDNRIDTILNAAAIARARMNLPAMA